MNQLARRLRSRMIRFLPLYRWLLAHSPAVMWRRRQVNAAQQARRSIKVHMHETDCRMQLDPSTYFAEVYVKGSYEPGLTRYLKAFLRPGMTCIDVGANVGYITLLMARQVGATGRVFCFEPTPRTFQMLMLNISLNGFSNVTAERVALSDREGKLEFREGPPGFEVYNTVGEITHPSAVSQVFTESQVDCLTLDQYWESRGNRTVDLIKIDVEGSELAVLKGMERILRTNPDCRMVIEFADVTARGFGYCASDLGTWLLERGWALAVLTRRGGLVPYTATVGSTGDTVIAYRQDAPQVES